MLRVCRVLLWAAATAGCWILPAPASALINLELRPANQVVNVGDFADLELYAVSDNGSDQLMSAADILFTWDPTYLDLVGLDQTGATATLTSFFPQVDPWGGINNGNPPTSGTGLYSVSAFPGPANAIVATPAGTLLTTFLIDAIAPTPNTVFSLVMTVGGLSQTTVYDGTTPNTDVTGTLGVAHVTILPEPGTLVFGLLGAAALSVRRRARRS